MSDIGEQFLDACVDQEVYLDVDLESSIALSEVRGRAHISQQDGVLVGVIAAAQYLEDEPRRRLAESRLDVGAFEDMPSRLLAELVNKSLGVEQDRTPAFQVKRAAEKTRGTCPSLERYWNETFAELEKEAGRAPKVQIFTKAGEPVAMRKGRGEHTGLLLRDAAIGGSKVVYPAGSAVDLSTRVDRYDPIFGTLEMLSTVPEVLPVSAIRTMSFRRLTPYAVPESQRSEHFGGRDEGCRSMKEIRVLAQQALRGQKVCVVEDIPLPRYVLGRALSKLRAA